MSPENTQKPRTPAQIEASRANGAKSHGPSTDQGKDAIRNNGIVHGFRACSAALAKENPTAYEAHLAAYMNRYQPVDKVEQDLVGLLAASMWQIMRNTAIEVALFDLEIAHLDEAAIQREYAHFDEVGRLALAFKNSHKENALELMRRYKTSTERAYHRALQAIEQIRKDRENATAAAQKAPKSDEISDSADQTQESVPTPKPVTPFLVPPANTHPSTALHPAEPQESPSEPNSETKFDPTNKIENGN